MERQVGKGLEGLSHAYPVHWGGLSKKGQLPGVGPDGLSQMRGAGRGLRSAGMGATCPWAGLTGLELKWGMVGAKTEGGPGRKRGCKRRPREMRVGGASPPGVLSQDTHWSPRFPSSGCDVSSCSSVTLGSDIPPSPSLALPPPT